MMPREHDYLRPLYRHHRRRRSLRRVLWLVVLPLWVVSGALTYALELGGRLDHAQRVCEISNPRSDDARGWVWHTRSAHADAVRWTLLLFPAGPASTCFVLLSDGFGQSGLVWWPDYARAAARDAARQGGGAR